MKCLGLYSSPLIKSTLKGFVKNLIFTQPQGLSGPGKISHFFYLKLGSAFIIPGRNFGAATSDRQKTEAANVLIIMVLLLSPVQDKELRFFPLVYCMD